MNKASAFGQSLETELLGTSVALAKCSWLPSLSLTCLHFLSLLVKNDFAEQDCGVNHVLLLKDILLT